MDFISLARKRYPAITGITLAFVLVALVITFTQPLKYGTEAKLLVVQSFNADVDAYSASRLNEYLSGLFVRVISSETFFNQTLDAGFDIDRSYFSGSRNRQIKQWEKTVSARSTYDSGIITLTVYHPDKTQAENIAKAAIYTLKTTNNFYHSIPNVDMRTIDSPSTSRWPVKPNIILNAALGIIFGLAAAAGFVYYDEQKKRRHGGLFH